MTAKAADRNVRLALIDAAARLLTTGERLTIRRLADEVGTSTMAVYTHFGSLDQLLREVREEGFARLGGYLRQVTRTRDPVADLAALGYSYGFNAYANPDLYRVMFLDERVGASRRGFDEATYGPLVDDVERCAAAGRFAPADARDTATGLWLMSHGAVVAVLAGLVGAEEVGAHLTRMFVAQFIGLGDDPDAARRSIRNGQRRGERRLGPLVLR